MNLQRYKEYKASIKRTADFLEKIAAFSFGVAAFQDKPSGIIFCAVFFATAQILTTWEAKL